VDLATLDLTDLDLFADVFPYARCACCAGPRLVVAGAHRHTPGDEGFW